MTIRIQDPLFLLSAQTGLSVGELAAQAAQGSPDINKPQEALKTGEPIPIVFCRRRNSNGGVMIQPKMSEGSFSNPIVEVTYTNDNGSTYTKFPNQVARIKYLLVLSEGNLPLLQIRDLFHGNCRRGTYNQAYNARAGTWDPGNTIDDHFDYVIQKDVNGVFNFNFNTLTNGQSARVGNTVYYRNTDGVLYTNIEYIEQTFPAFCGNSGTYSGLTTLSFEYEQKEAAADKLDRTISAFIRGGLQVTRLVDSTTGESDNYADLAKYLFQANNRLADDLIDNTALTIAAKFADANGFLFNGALTESQNLLDWLQETSVNFLLRTSNSGGKFGLVPRLPYNTDFTIKTTQVTPEFTFTEDHIVDGGFEISYISLEDREPVCFEVYWRQQPEADFGLVRTVQVRYAGEATNGPFVSIDMSDYCTSENHAVKVGAFRLAQRKFVTHHLRLTVRERSYNSGLVVGDLVRVRLRRETSEGGAEYHDKLYEINRIEKEFQGAIVYDLTHFPINTAGQSIVARQVADAVGAGNVINVGRSTFSCDENSSTATTLVGTSSGGGGSNQPAAADTEVGIAQPNQTYDPLNPGLVLDIDTPYPGDEDDYGNPDDALEDDELQEGFFLPYEFFKENTEYRFYSDSDFPSHNTMLSIVENAGNEEGIFYVGTSGNIIVDPTETPFSRNYIDTYSINTDNTRNHIGRISNIEDYSSIRYLKLYSAFHPRASDIGKPIESYFTNRDNTSEEVLIGGHPPGVTDSGLTYDWCWLEYEITSSDTDIEYNYQPYDDFILDFPNDTSEFMDFEGITPDSAPTSESCNFPLTSKLGEGADILPGGNSYFYYSRPLNHIWVVDGKSRSLRLFFNMAALKTAFPSERYIKLQFFPSFRMDKLEPFTSPTNVTGTISAKFYKGGIPVDETDPVMEDNEHTVTATKTQSFSSFSYTVSSVVDSTGSVGSSLTRLIVTNATDRSITLDTQNYEFTSA